MARRLGTLIGEVSAAARSLGYVEALEHVAGVGEHAPAAKQAVADFRADYEDKMRRLAKALADLGYRPGDEA